MRDRVGVGRVGRFLLFPVVFLEAVVGFSA